MSHEIFELLSLLSREKKSVLALGNNLGFFYVPFSLFLFLASDCFGYAYIIRADDPLYGRRVVRLDVHSVYIYLYTIIGTQGHNRESSLLFFSLYFSFPEFILCGIPSGWHRDAARLHVASEHERFRYFVRRGCHTHPGT